MSCATRLPQLALLTSALLPVCGSPQAQSTIAAPRVVVTAPLPENAAPGRLPLNVRSATGSRLDLEIRETPASVDLVGAETIRQRGFASAIEAVESTPGVQCGGAPGDPVSCSMRGFTVNQVTQLYDGLRVGPASMTSRPLDPFNFASVDILRGPASVLYGEGAVAGAINLRPRRPVRGNGTTDALLSFGSFDTLRIGIGKGGSSKDETLHYRLDFSRQSSDGWVDRTPYTMNALTSAILWDVTDRLALQFSFDVSTDDISPYWGTPLVPGAFARQPVSGVVTTTDGRTLDRRLIGRNYNVADNVMSSESYWTKLRAEYRASDALTFRNEFYYFHAEREWRNAETYTFNTGTSLIDRDRFFVAHRQNLVGNRLDGTYQHTLFGMPNRVLGGLDVSYLDFWRPSGFDAGDSVDPFHPTAGRFGPIGSALQTTRMVTTGLFAEDVLSLTDKLKVVTGLRTESIGLDRNRYATTGAEITGPQGGFNDTFRSSTYRLGIVHEPVERLNVYGQVSSGNDPVGENVFLVRANQNFKLASSFQWELGLKQSFAEDTGEWTLAYFDITRKNSLSRTALDEVANVGQQSSRGIESGVAFRPMRNARISANYAYIDARFDNFREGISPDTIHDGKRPPNVPRHAVNVYATYQFEPPTPVEVGTSFRYVSDRMGNNTNTTVLSSYHTIDAFVAWIHHKSRITFRVRNLTDRTYAQWVDVFYPDQVLIGAPRSFEVSLTTRF